MKIKLTDSVSGLQFFQLLKFTSFFIVSIVFTKSHLSPEDIGSWEMFMFIASFLNFFWVTGLIQSFLSLFRRNVSFKRLGENETEKSPEFFNAFILLFGFSLIFFIGGHLLKTSFSVYGITGNVQYLNLILLYLLLSSPVCLVEYIYLLRGKTKKIIHYGLLTFIPQLILIITPILLGKGYLWSIYGLILSAAFRWIWLFILLKKYAEFKISPKFIREHLRLGAPLILTALISNSAQYIDGLIVSSHFDNPREFAIFRYGAKEFPIVFLMANALSAAMLPHFATKSGMREALQIIKNKSRKLMHYLFPISILMLFLATWLYRTVFTPEFHRSADVFVIYLLLIIPRLVFPQTILIGKKRTMITLYAAIFELSLNIPLSLWLIRDYGTVGVALATFIVYTFEKAFLASYLWFKMGINPQEYIPIKTLAVYTIIISTVFVLIDHKIINLLELLSFSN